MSIEQNINDLKEQVKNYELLSDYDKIMNEEYGEIIDEKENCIFMLNEFKTNLNDISNKKINIGKCDDSKFEITMNKVNSIKYKINETNDLETMMLMYKELHESNQLLKTYFTNKKMEIINM